MFFSDEMFVASYPGMPKGSFATSPEWPGPLWRVWIRAWATCGRPRFPAVENQRIFLRIFGRNATNWWHIQLQWIQFWQHHCNIIELFELLVVSLEMSIQMYSIVLMFFLLSPFGKAENFVSSCEDWLSLQSWLFSSSVQWNPMGTRQSNSEPKMQNYLHESHTGLPETQCKWVLERLQIVPRSIKLPSCMEVTTAPCCTKLWQPGLFFFLAWGEGYWYFWKMHRSHHRNLPG